MSREEAVEILSDMRAEYNIFGDEEEATRYHVLSWAIQAMKATQPWIPVTERLPEKNGRYLVTCEQWGAWEVDWNIWYMTPRPGWLWEKGITAWMPLPEPWKEKKDE